MKKGLKIGEESGLKKGLKIAEEKAMAEKMTSAKHLKEMGMSVKDIASAMNLPKEIVEQL